MTDTTKPYYGVGGASTRFYDILTAADASLEGDIALYAELAGNRSRILELGAGTGRVAIALAERGYDVTGLNIAPAMLALAEEKKRALPEEVAARLHFVRGDLTALALGRSFDAIFATYFTLAHLQPATTWRRAFAGMARHLAPGGILALHLPIAEQMVIPPPPADKPVFQRSIGDDQMLTLFVVDKKNTASLGRMDLSLDYVVSTREGVEVRRSRERFTYFAADPIPYAARAGLRPAGTPIPVGKAGFIHMFE